MLLEHRDHVLLTMALGTLAAALLGYAMARRGLRPVQMVARAAGDITAEPLGERLRIEDAPAELFEMVQAFNRMLENMLFLARADNAQVALRKGAFVKSIMTSHGGTVCVESKPGGVTTFSQVFPSG